LDGGKLCRITSTIVGIGNAKAQRRKGAEAQSKYIVVLNPDIFDKL